MLSVKNLHVRIAGKDILKGLNLEVSAGEVHAIMGPNGSGKSTFAKTLAGDPNVEILQGEVLFKGADLLALAPDQRALAGVFMAFQYPVEIPGVNNAAFLRMAYNARRKARGLEELDPIEFDTVLSEKRKVLDIPEAFLDRAVNQGFSGGEKKRNEVLQMAVLDPALAVLDETDSGLDVDSLRTVAQGVNNLRRPDNAMILVTHYQRILSYVEPDKVHILFGGRIVRSGGKDLALEVERRGYDWILNTPSAPALKG